jgi:DNA-binding CsgD family transcriptional regulator
VSFGPIHEGAELPLDQTYCERVIKNFVPGVIPDTAQEDLVRRLDVTEQADIGSYVAIPIHLSDGTLYGTLCCLSHAPGTLLDEQDLRFARLLGMLAAHQIERQNLTDALLRTQHAVHRALSRARTVDEVAVEILSAIGSPLGYESGVLWSVGRRAGELRAAARWSRLDGGASDTGTASPPARAPAAVAQARETARPVAEAMVLAVPLTCDDAVVGVLEFSRGDRHQTDERTLAFLVELAASIGRALRPLSGWAGSGPLTAREREVLQLMADGLNLQQTAARLDVSRHTVRAHWRNVYEKLDVSDKAAAVAAGFRRRLIL